MDVVTIAAYTVFWLGLLGMVFVLLAWSGSEIKDLTERDKKYMAELSAEYKRRIHRRGK